MTSTSIIGQSVTRKQKDAGFIIENGIITGVEKLHAFNHGSIGELIFDFLNRKPEHIAQIDALTGRKITCKELKERSIRLAIWMIKEGIETGDIIALSSPDHIDIVIVIVASMFVGATYAPCCQVMNMESARRNINYLKPRVMFTCKDNVSDLQEAARIEKHVWKMIVLDTDHVHPSLDYILELQSIEEVFQFQLKSKINSSTMCLLSSTSGTTGVAKIVSHTYEAIQNWYSAFCKFDQTEVQNEVGLSYLYPDWNAHSLNVLYELLEGSTQIFHAEFDPRETCKIIEKYQVNSLTMSTYCVSLLCQDNTLNKYGLKSVTSISPLGTKLYPNIEQKLRKIFPDAAIDKLYGSSESLGLTSTRSGCLNSDSMGTVSPNVQLKIVEIRSGATLGPGQVGEICAKSPYIMKGYYKDPIMTKLVFDDDGWYHSGDTGYYEESGEIFILGRLKEVIRFRDIDVHPTYVEKILLTHPNIVDVAVVGIQHDVDVECPVAFVKVAKDSSVEEEDILEITRELEYCNTFKGSIIFIDQMPRSSNGKIKKYILRERAEKMYAQR